MSETIDAILQEAEKQSSSCELFHQTGEVQTITFENNHLKKISSRQYEGVGLRMVVDGRLGFASTTDLRDPADLVTMARESAQFGDVAQFNFPAQPAQVNDVKMADTAVEDISRRTMVDMGSEALQQSREADDNYLFSASIKTGSYRERVANSRGLDITRPSTSMSASAEIQETRDDGLLQVYESKSWSQPFNGILDITGKALKKMQQADQVVRPSASTMPVIFIPKSMHNLLRPIMTAVNGKLVQKGSSLLTDRIGEKVLDERISILDDATIDFAPGSSPIDDEGYPTRKFPLFDQGILRSYLDRKSVV